MTIWFGFLGCLLLIAGLIWALVKTAERNTAKRVQNDALNEQFNRVRKANGIETVVDSLTPSARRERLREWSGK